MFRRNYRYLLCYCAFVFLMIELHTVLPFTQNSEVAQPDLTILERQPEPQQLQKRLNPTSETTTTESFTPKPTMVSRQQFVDVPSNKLKATDSINRMDLTESSQEKIAVKHPIENHEPVRRMDLIETSQDHWIHLDRFRSDPIQTPNSRWVAYFFEEAIAIVLLRVDVHELIDCSVIEVRKQRLQRQALQRLGTVMELVPIPLEEMVQLISLCGTVNSVDAQPTSLPLQDPHTTHMTSSQPSSPFSAGSLVLPGTLWCGMRDRADRYERLGEQSEADRCCRAHDHCPIKVSMFETLYGYSNYGFGTRSHCRCEIEFYRCLKKARTETSAMIGDFYFNVLGLDCLDDDKKTDSLQAGSLQRHPRGKSLDEQPKGLPYQCIKFDREHRCRMWRKRRDLPTQVSKKSFGLKF